MLFIINIILGIPLLIWGRKVFWLFVGAVGFITGLTFSPDLFPGSNPMLPMVVGAALGFIGAILAIFLQKIVVTITGFLAGVYLITSVINFLQLDPGPITWFLYMAAGAIGSLLVLGLFDWALILLSSLIGASLISQSSFDMLRFEPAPRSIIFIVLLIIGIIVQYDQKQRELP